MRAVNLLPSERRDQDGRGGATGSSGGGGGALTTGRVAIAGGALAVAVSGLVGFMFVGARSDVAEKRNALEAVQTQVAEAQTRAAAQAQQVQAASTALPADVKAQLDAFNMVASARIQWDLLLGDVSRVLPSDSWLSSLTLQGAPAAEPAASTGSTPAVAATPTGFVASGFALSQPTVARLMQRLALVPMLSDITLQRSERANVGADKAFQFTLSANVRTNGASC
jgi:Tfp pilus assembly protein PilN